MGANSVMIHVYIPDIFPNDGPRHRHPWEQSSIPATVIIFSAL